jgi:diguanylate cyclase (GGDEF)-like protein
MRSQRDRLCVLLTILTVETVLLTDPVRPWLPFSLWTMDDTSLSVAGIFAFLALAVVGGFLPVSFPGLKPLPVTFPLIGACLVLYGLPPATGLAVMTVTITAWRWKRERLGLTRRPLDLLAPTLAGAGLGLLMADVSGYLIPAGPPAREFLDPRVTLAMGALLTFGTATAALVARYLEGSRPRTRSTAAEWSRTFFAAIIAAGIALAAAQAVKVWTLGPVALWLSATTACAAPLAVAWGQARRATATECARAAGLTQIIEALALAIEAKDRVSARHLKRMRVMARGLGLRLGLNEEELALLDLSTLLHDVGKLAVPEWILSKPGCLTEEEFQKMTAHAETGGKILDAVPYARNVAPLVRHHHEHFDGTGYPAGLSGLEIPLGARILAVADAFDSISSERAYHHPLGTAETLDYIRSKSGSTFDPRVVRTLVEHYDEIMAEAEQVETAMTETGAGSGPKQVAAAPRPASEELSIPARIQDVLDTIASAHMEIYSLHEIRQALGKALNVEESLSLIAARLGSLFHFTASAVYVLDRERGILTPRLTTGRGADRLRDLEIPVGTGLTGWAARERRTIIGAPSSEPLLRDRVRSDFDGLEDRGELAELVSCVAAPVLAEQEVVGVIALYDTAATPYCEAEERLLSMVARQVGPAVRTGLLFERTQEHTLTDFLTGLPNARYMFMVMDQQFGQTRESGDPFSLLLMNLDGFGKLNEEFGHSFGDRFLVGVSKAIRSQMRDQDTCARFSGDEFVAILPGVAREEAIQVAERIRRSVESFVLEGSNRKRASLTISAGHATLSLDGTSFESLMAAAQDRLSNMKTMRCAEGAPGTTLFPFRRREESGNG